MYYGLTVLAPGETSASAKFARVKIRNWLANSASATDRRMARNIDVTSTYYGPGVVAAVRRFQRSKHITADGIIGPKTWLVFGYQFHHLLELPGYSFRGIPWTNGVVMIDGNWLNVKAARKLQQIRAAKKWTGSVYSGYRPDWYQAILWRAAVKKYGSEAAAAKWVARPGTSNHRHVGPKGAVDLTNPAQVLNARVGFYQPMSWEDWHLQLRGAHTTSRAAGVRGIFDGEEFEPTPDEIEAATHYIDTFLIPNLPGAA